MPSFISSTLRVFGGCAPNSARWISSELNRPARRTTILPPSSSHSKTEPGPMPSFRRTSIGTEIWPCAVTFECAIAIPIYYQGNGALLCNPHLRQHPGIFEGLIFQAIVTAGGAAVACGVHLDLQQ